MSAEVKIERRDDELYDFANTEQWPTPVLSHHAKILVMEKEVAFGHEASEMDRRLGHAAFELWYRAHWENKPQVAPEAAMAG